ncbi:ABC transporter ATP-binding protein [Pararhizobium mangrovi]|uniref:ABC transporter ATP-binding protein n=1 Tax=Pararhizobium mangrovi TaxID=2590452 RepID=A0A506U9W0_9HYPH|nr:ABC transporter ATP-binding protein [Pararhizobium mangrovi]TPW30660.1 ABC transporter ATP-binding protein [Pararhizobium mangrovi]
MSRSDEATTDRISANGQGLAPDEVLAVERLSTHFVYKNRTAKVIRDVSFRLKKGRTLAIVGESGSGKSVTSLSIMGLLSEPGRVVDGRILYRLSSGEAVDLTGASKRTMRRIRGREISMIFQEPMSSLNPLQTVGDQIAEMIWLHMATNRANARKRAVDLLRLVEIPGAERRIDDYPHHMSGGMRQRVMIAMALACDPSLLIADEPTTALDVTIQAQILDLMRRLQGELDMSILFITHDMGVVAEIADDVAVMYAGVAVEQAPVRRLFDAPNHPYTRGLLASIPEANRERDDKGQRVRLTAIPGTVPSLYDLPPGCPFETRCAWREEACLEPVSLEPCGPDHLSRCWKMRQA